MSKIVILFLFVALVAVVAVAFPTDDASRSQVSLRTVREAKAEPKAVAAALPRRGGYYRGRGGYHGHHGYHNHRGYGHRGYGHSGYGRRYGRSASLSKSFADVSKFKQ